MNYEAYVITLKDTPESVKMSNRCIKSGKDNGIEIKQFDAKTPDDLPWAEDDGINFDKFDEKWSRSDRARAAFYSHYSLWERSFKSRVPVLIFEHDAFITSSLPDQIIGSTNGVVNLGMPSYGRFNPPHQMGLSPLFSKPYFPGAHAYLVTPQGAGTLISQAHECAKPTDVFLHIDVFPWLQEYSPYIAEARDTFSTIQNENGIQAKHAFQKIGEKYKLI